MIIGFLLVRSTASTPCGLCNVYAKDSHLLVIFRVHCRPLLHRCRSCSSNAPIDSESNQLVMVSFRFRRICVFLFPHDGINRDGSCWSVTLSAKNLVGPLAFFCSPARQTHLDLMNPSLSLRATYFSSTLGTSSTIINSSTQLQFFAVYKKINTRSRKYGKSW